MFQLSINSDLIEMLGKSQQFIKPNAGLMVIYHGEK